MNGPADQAERTVEQLERQLRDTESALESARREGAEAQRLALLGQIASGIGHELREPLGIIAALLQCLRDAGIAESTRVGPGVAVRELIEAMETQVTLAGQIVSNLQEYARTQHPKRCPTDLNLLVDKQSSRLAVPANVLLRKELAAGLPLTPVDPFHIERAFHNLALNALESMRDGGGELCVCTYAAGECVVVEVRDTGAGVPEDIRDKIFQPLFSTRSSGLGLGLALTRQLVEANGGSVAFCPQASGGSIFQLRLPLE